MYNVSIMQSGKKNLLNVSKNICDLTVDPVRFVKGGKQTRLNVVSTDPLPQNTAINICLNSEKHCRFKRGKVRGKAQISV